MGQMTQPTVTKHWRTILSLVIPPWVGAIKYWRWSLPPLRKKQWVLPRPCYQDSWHIGLVGYRCWPLWCQSTGQLGSYGSLSGYPSSAQSTTKGIRSIVMDLAGYAETWFCRCHVPYQPCSGYLWAQGSWETIIPAKLLLYQEYGSFIPLTLPQHSLCLRLQAGRDLVALQMLQSQLLKLTTTTQPGLSIQALSRNHGAWMDSLYLSTLPPATRHLQLPLCLGMSDWEERHQNLASCSLSASVNLPFLSHNTTASTLWLTTVGQAAVPKLTCMASAGKPAMYIPICSFIPYLFMNNSWPFPGNT